MNKYTQICISNKIDKGTYKFVLIVVVLIALVIIFQEQALTLVAKIWTTITENASNITG